MVTTQDLFTDTDNLMYDVKMSIRKRIDFSNYSTKSNYYDNSNKLVAGK